ncbi:MAG: Bax inhibitor-1 family protein [Acidimicrobiales bacterium]|nr:Bax inhibitor-1 family protein [Acidimicrobiales bacterium]
MSYPELDLRPVAELDDTTRGDFVVRVYQHLVAAIVVFAGIEALFLNTPIAEGIFDFATSGGMSWLLILGLFMVGQWIVANSAADLLNPQKQYAALFGSAALYAVLFAPMLHYIFRYRSDGGTTVAAAGLITAIAFAGLTVVGFVTRKDLSFLRPITMYGFVCAGVLIVGAILFGFNLGVWFSVAMIALSGVAILWQTQTIIRKFPSQAHVAAALGLFSSVMTMFWYVLRLFVGRD